MVILFTSLDGCEKDERLQQLVAQVDVRNKELLKLKNSAVNEVTVVALALFHFKILV